eukprot:UN09816
MKIQLRVRFLFKVMWIFHQHYRSRLIISIGKLNIFVLSRNIQNTHLSHHL